MMKEVLTSIKKAGIGTAMLTGLLFYTSCQDDTNVGSQASLGDEIKFSVVSDSIVAARSLASGSMSEQGTRHFLTTIGKDSLFLYAKVEDNYDSPRLRLPAAGGNARGISYGIGELGADAFYVTAFVNQDAQFMNNTKVEKKNGNWSYAPIKYWPNNATDKVNFFGYLTTPGGPVPQYVWNEEQQCHEGAFFYELPAPGGDSADAQNQPDLIFAMTPNQTKANNPVELAFYHALSAIQFKVGTLPEDIQIKTLYVDLQKVKDGGQCTMSPVDGGIRFVWNNESAVDKTYSQLFLNDDGLLKGEAVSADANTFMMVPQTFDGEEALVFRFKLENKDYKFSYPLKNLHADWQFNKKYVYTLSITEYVEVNVEDKVSGTNRTLKDEVTIQNTGLADVYIRAAIVGYWVKENNVVAGWRESDEVGKFSGLPGTNWVKGLDGFYYHQHKVKAGDVTSPLFTSYELTGSPAVVGSSLKLNIVVQAVKYSDVDKEGVWKDAVSSIVDGVLTPKTKQ